jgi:hypothetical protein
MARDGNYALRRLDRDGHAAVAAPIAASFHPSLRRYLATPARSFRVNGLPVAIAFCSTRTEARSSFQSLRSGLSSRSRNARAARICVSYMPGVR